MRFPLVLGDPARYIGCVSVKVGNGRTGLSSKYISPDPNFCKILEALGNPTIDFHSRLKFTGRSCEMAILYAILKPKVSGIFTGVVSHAQLSSIIFKPPSYVSEKRKGVFHQYGVHLIVGGKLTIDS